MATAAKPPAVPFATSAAAAPAAAPAAHKPFTLALCQLLTTADKTENLDAAEAAVSDAVARGAQVVVLPECFNSPYATDQFPVFAEPIPATAAGISEVEHPTTARLHALARKHGITLIGGSFPERDGAKVYNTCVAVGPDGTLLAKYRKVHLFDIDIPGGITFKESETLSAGNDLAVIDTPHGRVGIGICYDLRFPQLAMLMAARGCRLLVYPGAFNTTTGPAHWELLLRSRALDNQVFVAACSPARGPPGGYPAWGHSTVVNPWGEVIATTSHHATTVFTEVTLSQVDDVRAQVPVTVQKRDDLYSVAWSGGGAGAGAGAGVGSASGAAKRRRQ